MGLRPKPRPSAAVGYLALWNPDMSTIQCSMIRESAEIISHFSLLTSHFPALLKKKQNCGIILQKEVTPLLTDLHTHTHHSYDAADETVAERIAAAKRLGLRVMAITDHVEINRFFDADHYHAQETEEFTYGFSRAFAGSVHETFCAKQGLEGLTLLCGAEVGQIPQAPEIARVLYDDPRIDLIIGSVHELPGRADFYFLDYAQENIPKLIGEYFEEVLRLAETDCYDILAHLTYGLRYLPNRAEIDLTPYLPIIDRIFFALITGGRALELNGSGLKYATPYTDPDFALIARYRSLGGRLLTLGTDAHETRHLGLDLDRLEQLARDAGFTELTYFERHEPKFLSL